MIVVKIILFTTVHIFLLTSIAYASLYAVDGLGRTFFLLPKDYIFDLFMSCRLFDDCNLQLGMSRFRIDLVESIWLAAHRLLQMSTISNQ